MQPTRLACLCRIVWVLSVVSRCRESGSRAGEYDYGMLHVSHVCESVCASSRGLIAAVYWMCVVCVCARRCVHMGYPMRMLVCSYDLLVCV